MRFPLVFLFGYKQSYEQNSMLLNQVSRWFLRHLFTLKNKKKNYEQKNYFILIILLSFGLAAGL